MRMELSRSFEENRQRIAVVEASGRALTYRELGELGDSICEGLPCRSGLIFIAGGNDPNTLAAYAAALRRGYTVMLLDGRDPNRHGEILARYRPDSIISCDIEGHEIEHGPGNDQPAVHPDIALLFSTSGSTGSPRLVKITTGNILSNTLSIIEYLGMSADDRAITLLPPFYTFGLSIVNSHFIAGGSLLLTDRGIQDPGIWTLMSERGVTSFSGVPHTFELCADSIHAISTVRSLRYVTQAGGKLSRDLVKRFASAGARQGWKFYVMYGQTEASPRISYLPPELAESNPESIGIPVPGGRLEIEDEQGRVITNTDVEGELVYYGPNVMAGYAESREDLQRAHSTGRLATGDLARRKPNGLFVVTGRKSRFIKPMGLRIGLDDVEERLGSAGCRVAATAARDQLVVHVEESPGASSLSSDRIGELLGLPPSMIRVHRVPALPRLANGKVDYPVLAAAIATSAAITPLWRHPWRLLREIGKEALAILLGAPGGAHSVLQVFSELTGIQDIQWTDSFTSLGGDSMSYVECTVFLESIFDEVPSNWHLMSIRDLENAREAAT